MKKAIKAISLVFAIILIGTMFTACGDTSTPSQSGTSDNGSTTNITTGQKNAVAKAKDYLSISAFSRDGLVEQLEVESFTTEEAEYGADNCGADWKEQAVKKAKEYLDVDSFSKDGLTEQLIFEKFTEEQANYGAEKAYE